MSIGDGATWVEFVSGYGKFRSIGAPLMIKRP
jgi:hypothetical protein